MTTTKEDLLEQYKNGGLAIQAATTEGDTTVVPVTSSEKRLTPGEFEQFKLDREFRFINDDTIRNLEKNTVDYTTEVGEWIMQNDDLVPGIHSRLKGLILGAEGLTVEPEDPDSEADNRLADYLEDVYNGRIDLFIDPEDVVDVILGDNMMNAVSVLRSVDLEHVEIESLDYVKDGISGEEIYIQESVSYDTFEIEDDGTVDVNEKSRSKEQALEIGEDVFDISLYRTSPIKSVANDIVNKAQMKRLKARKAEIASIGGIYISIHPPEYIAEADYTDPLEPDKHSYGDGNIPFLDYIMREEMKRAIQTLQNYQTATIMSVPDHWEVQTLDVPTMNETFDEMIRGYNEAIARRLLFPLDLLELQSGSELSRDTMFQTVINTIAGWQGDITRVFDEFAVQIADQHSISGNVEHSLPTVGIEDEKQILQMLKFAGLLGLSQSESRKLVNELEGVDLDPDADTGSSLPPAGGTVEQRENATQEVQDVTQQVQNPDGQTQRERVTASAYDYLAASFSEGDVVEHDGEIGVVLESHSGDFTLPTEEEETVSVDEGQTVYVVAMMSGGFDTFTESELTSGEFEEEDLPDELEAQEDPEVGFEPGEPEGWDRSSVLQAYAHLGGSFTSCVTEMSGEIGQPKSFCAALKDSVYGTELWR